MSTIQDPFDATLDEYSDDDAILEPFVEHLIDDSLYKQITQIHIGMLECATELYEKNPTRANKEYLYQLEREIDLWKFSQKLFYY